MKKAGLLILCLWGTYLSAQELPDEEEGHEHEKSLNEMSILRGGASSMYRFTDEMMNYRNSHPQTLAANWSFISDAGTANGDLGRVNSVTLDTINAGRFYVCTPHSGVWLTNNNGTSYTPITESLPTQSSSRLIIDPTNTNVLYLATGIHNMDMPANSIGVYKSTDGGLTWNATGLTFNASAAVTIGDMIINPQNHNSLVAATTDGLYRTYNGGTSWTRVLNDTFYSVRFRPGDTSYAFAVGRRFYRTDDAWTNWAMITSTFHDNYTWKFEYQVRVSAATPNLVYLMTQGNSIGPGPRGYVHVSNDGGWSFATIDSLFGQTQMQFDVSQQTANKYMLGYYTIFKRNNASFSLSQMTWNSSAQPPYVHSDQRGIFFDPRNDNTIYLCNDGGLKRSTDNGNTFQNLNANMQLAHIYNFGESQSQGYKILPATLDVSPFLLGNSGVTRTYPLVEAFIAAMSPVNDSVYMLGHQTPYFTSNDWTTYYASSCPFVNNATNYPKAFQFSENNENESFMGSQGYIYHSTDYGANHPQTWQLPWFTYNIMYELDVSASNPNYKYMRYADSLYMTNGVNYIDITPGLPMDSVSGSAVTIDPENERNVWITFSGYSAGNKVFFSNDAGFTWNNMSAGLPNVPVNDIVCQRGGPAGAVYCATDGGVFYRDSSFTSWQYYNTGLPNVIVTDLDIQYGIGKLRASTFGRGMWESDLYAPSSVLDQDPVAENVLCYPNPVSQTLYIQATATSLGEIVITDMTGREILRLETENNAVAVDVSGLASGCYFVHTRAGMNRFLRE